MGTRAEAEIDDAALVICIKYQDFVQRLSARAASNPTDALDMSQAVFLDLIQAARNGVIEPGRDAEVRRRVIWRCIDFRRKEAMHRALFETGYDLDALPALRPYVPGNPVAQRRQVDCFIRQWLPADSARIVLSLVWPSKKLQLLARDGHNGNGRVLQRHVAEFLGVSVHQVRRAMRRARKAIPQEV